MTSRLFVSLDLPDYIIEEIVSLRNDIYGVGYDRVRWESSDKLHLTMKFLGDVDDNDQHKILAVLQSVSAKYSKVELEFNKFGMFLRNGVPSILWLGLEPSQQIIAIKNDIENQLAKVNFSKDSKRFKPHLTILRIKGRENKERLDNFISTEIENIDCSARSISLIKSELLLSGSVYTPIKSFQLI